MEYVKDHFQPMQLHELGGFLRRRRVPLGSVIITFDDGYADNFWYAKPILEKHAIPATFFITAGYAGMQKEFWWDELERLLQEADALSRELESPERDWTYKPDPDPERRREAHLRFRQVLRPLSNLHQQDVLATFAAQLGSPGNIRHEDRAMNWDELRALSENDLFEIGSHSMTHPVLISHSLAYQERELLGSKWYLEEMLEREVSSFSYPYGGTGDIGQITLRATRRAGYDVACCTAQAPLSSFSNPYYLTRYFVEDWGREQFSRNLHEWLYR